MTDTELIVFQAKQHAEDNTLIDYYRKRCDSLEAQLRLKENITESNDDIPLAPEGLYAQCKMTTAKGEK